MSSVLLINFKSREIFHSLRESGLFLTHLRYREYFWLRSVSGVFYINYYRPCYGTDNIFDYIRVPGLYETLLGSSPFYESTARCWDLASSSSFLDNILPSAILLQLLTSIIFFMSFSTASIHLFLDFNASLLPPISLYNIFSFPTPVCLI